MKNNMTTGSDIEGTSNKRLVPKLRFPEFRNDGGWKEVILGEAFERISEKNVNNNRNVLTISAQYGLVSQYDYFNKNVAAANIKSYYFIHKGDFAYNKSRSQGYPFGVIKPLRRYESGVVSTLYICFRAKTNCCIDFYEQYFDTDLINNELSKIAQEGARNHGLLNMSVDDFFNKIKLLVPHSSEREKVAGCLLSIDEEISALKEKVEQLKIHKKGLMQKLFPVAGKFVPELRFSELKNDGEWKEEPLGYCYILKGGYAFKSSMFQNEGIPIIRISNIPTDSLFVDLSDCACYKKIPNDETFIINNGDLLLAMSGATTGKTAIYKQNKPAYLNQRVGVFKSIKDTNYYLFLCQWVKTYNYEKQLSRLLTAGTQPNVSSNDIETLIFKYPQNTKEQQKIAECLSSIDELISLYENKVTLLEQHKKGLMQQLFPKL